MSVSFIQRPAYSGMPAYNQIKFIADSSNKNLPGFRYVYSVYPRGTTLLSASTRITDFFIAPRIGDGYGVLLAEEIFQNYVTYDFDNAGADYINADDSWEGFDLYVGEAYGGGWDYDDYEFYSSTGSSNAHLQLRQFASATTHSFEVGDQINIVQDDGGALKPQISGLHTVVTELIFGDVGSGPSIGGEITYADNRRTIDRHQISATTLAINAAIPVEQTWNFNTYNVASGSSKSFLTNCPTTFSCTSDENMWFNFASSFSNNAYYIQFDNSNGDIFRGQVNDNSRFLQQVGVGPANAYITSTVSGSTGLVKSNTEWYKFKLVTSGGTAITNEYTINIDRRCTIDYDFGPTHLVFLDRLGSFGSFNMQLKTNLSYKVKRDTYNRDNGYNEAIDLTQGGDTAFSITEEKEVTLNTNWMTEDEAAYFDLIYASPVTLLYFGGQYLRVTVTEDSYEPQLQRNKRLIRKTVKVKFANNSNTNI
jgi:hypothetical protein